MRGWTNNRFNLIVLAALLGLLAARCAMQGSSVPVVPLELPPPPTAKSDLQFSHVLHLAFRFPCTDCHGEGPEMRVPREREGEFACLNCHEEKVGEREEPGETCGFCHLREDVSVRRWPQGRRLEGLVFSHEPHAVLACTDCHGGMEEAEGVPSGTPGDMAFCMECHERGETNCALCHDDLDTLEPWTHGAANWLEAHGTYGRRGGLAGTRNDCAGCHPGDPCVECHRSRRPGSHDGGWVELGHGPAARVDAEGCALCHERSACDACHVQHPPADHDNHFRHVGHGVAVSANRERCRACHHVDFCIRCHGEVSPRSHTLGWNNPQNRHCLDCHWPPGSGPENCTLCHKTFPGHAAQLPLSPAHATRSTNCDLCHGGVHPDNGWDACAECHP